jgi:hypothetical protein
MKFKTHIFQSLKNIILLFIIFAIFYIIAIAMSPAKYFTAIHYIKIFLPIWLIISTYLYLFSSTSIITITKDKIELDMKFGRKRHLDINISDINAAEKKSVFSRLFGAERIMLSSDNVSLADTISTFNHYLYLSKKDASDLLEIINTKNPVLL